jgi:hypothetical protein
VIQRSPAFTIAASTAFCTSATISSLSFLSIVLTFLLICLVCCDVIATTTLFS